MRVLVLFGVRSWLFCALLISTSSLLGVTFDELRRDPHMTPQRFARYFEDFKFRFHPEVQTPEVFLKTRSGDCDDYATLAAAILKERGYTPRLIAVRMKGVVHVVCYIEESQGYLDYQFRQDARTVVAAGNSLAAIADKVGETFHRAWTSVSEFTYNDGVKRLVQTVVSPPSSKDLAAR